MDGHLATQHPGTELTWRAGVPTTTAPAGTSFVTVEAAPTTAPTHATILQPALSRTAAALSSAHGHVQRRQTMDIGPVIPSLVSLPSPVMSTSCRRTSRIKVLMLSASVLLLIRAR